jgi:hypothetical protein
VRYEDLGIRVMADVDVPPSQNLRRGVGPWMQGKTVVAFLTDQTIDSIQTSSRQLYTLHTFL